MLEFCLYSFLLIYIIFFGIYFLLPLLGAPPYYPTKMKDVRTMIKMAALSPSDKVIDLGSGDGRLVIEASRYSKFVRGVEINPLLALFSNIRLLFLRRHKSARVIFGSYKNMDLSQYNVVFCYLLPNSMQFLQDKFDKELKPGTKIIANTFTMKQGKPVKTEGKIYLYVV